jgi:serine/threonine-protein kinase HipA
MRPPSQQAPGNAPTCSTSASRLRVAPLGHLNHAEGTGVLKCMCVFRIPFLSAMSLLNAADNETHSYMEIADALRQYGAKAEQDCAQLWRRIVFSILISNTDDHLRNHGFLYEGSGWRLAPAYDLNPMPTDIKPRILTTAIDEADGTASLDLAYAVASHFGVKPAKARTIARDVGAAVAGWRETAKAIGLTSREIDRMASAFEHEDLFASLKRS